jgi:hypothetical protein
LIEQSASSNCRSEDIRILPVVVAELEFRDVERHVFGTHLGESVHDATLEDRPETFNRLGKNRADDVLSFGVIDNGERVFLSEFLIARPLIGTQQADLVRDGFADKLDQRVGADVADSSPVLGGLN